MIDEGHTCLLIFAQGNWKESFKLKFFQQISKNFISNMNIDDRDEWSEILISPLFDPKNPGKDDHPCDVCHPLYDIFEEKKGENDGLILFSHNILGWKGMEKFLVFILREQSVKKIFYLELDSFSYIVGANIPKIMKDITDLKINRNDFFKLFRNEQIQINIVYEVSKY